MPVAAPGEPMRTLQINEAGSNRRGEVERWMSVVQDTISRCMWANKHSEERHSPCPQRVTQSGGEEECVCVRGALEERTSKSCGHIEALFSAFS